MKKIVNLICILSLSCGLLFAQNSSSSANRNTALRCLKLSENCFMSGDWNNALSQAELGLSYDDSISDLIYLKAAASMKLNKTKAEVINQIALAFEKNQWVGYSLNGARILYADLLSDVGRYDESMKVLDGEPFIFSADAEFIRIKNLYRMGTADSLRDARLKVNSSRRIYPKDQRFPNIFFMFELMYLNEAKRVGVEYNIPEIVKTIAGSYLVNLPDYKGKNPGIELMATFFADNSEKERLIKAIDARGVEDNALLAIAGLNIGLYSEQQAFDKFFGSANNSIHLGILENFALLLTDENVKKQFVELMNNYSGTIVIDENLDLQPELIVEYETGRPQIIHYDYNNDGFIDLYAACDFGAPKVVCTQGKNVKLYYSAFPNVSKISFADKDYVLNFINDDFQMSVLNLSVNNVFSTFGLEFYVPEVSKEIVIPPVEQLVKIASSVELPIMERENSRVVYSILDGNIVYADFFYNDSKYAYCDFSKGFPLVRYVDHDEDGRFETVETFSISDKKEDYITDDEKKLVNSIFNELTFDSDIYLSKVQVDRNNNTFYEFTEQYLGLDGKITIWDNNDDGIPDSRYFKYPVEDENQIKEDFVFYGKEGNPYVVINFLNSVPVKMNYNDHEVMIFAGKSDNFYWIEDNGNEKIEKFILENVASKLTNGIIDIVQYEDLRINVIKVNDNIFCKIIPMTKVDLVVEE